MGRFAASPGELSILWDAITDEPEGAFPVTSDGRRRWAWLVDLTGCFVSDVVAGFAGAIVLAEDGHGPIAATLYDCPSGLADAWEQVFVDVPPGDGAVSLIRA